MVHTTIIHNILLSYWPLSSLTSERDRNLLQLPPLTVLRGQGTVTRIYLHEGYPGYFSRIFQYPEVCVTEILSSNGTSNGYQTGFISTIEYSCTINTGEQFPNETTSWLLMNKCPTGHQLETYNYPQVWWKKSGFSSV